MKRATTLAVLSMFVAVCAAGAATPSRACDPTTTVSIAGFDNKGAVLVRHDRAQDGIDLVIVELATGEAVSTIEILRSDDPEAERQKLRGKRWKDAEAALAKQGFTINPKISALVDDKLGVGDFVIKRSAVSDDAAGFWGTRFEAKQGAHSVELVTKLAPSSDTPSFDGFFLSPDKRYLLLLESGCFPTVHAFEVSKLSKQLASAAAASKTPPKSEKKSAP